MSGTRELLPIADGRAVWRSMRHRLRPHRVALAVAAAVLLAGTSCLLVIPPVVGRIVDRVDEGAAMSALWTPIIVILVAIVAGSVLSYVADLMVARTGETIVADLREDVVERALALPIGQIEEAGSGDLVARVGNDVAVVADAVQRVLPGVLFTGLTIGLTVVGLAALDWRFALAAIAVMPIQTGTLRWYVRRCMPLYASERVADAELSHELLGSIRSADTVRAFRLGPARAGLISRRSEAANELAYAGTHLRTRLYGRLNVAEAIGLSAILTVGYFLVDGGAVTIGATTAAALYFHRIFDPVNALVGLFDDLLVANAGLARIIGVTDAPAPAAAGAGPPPVDASVATTDVGYAYRPGSPVVRDVTLRVDAHEHLAIVGASGAGKSTLAKLIAGIHPPTTGTVTLGGQDIVRLDAGTIRDNVVFVSQEVHVFAGTVADDLRLARPGADDTELRAALTALGADWIDDLPDGLDTVVGEAGRQLSSLQAQQLALARVILADPPIVVLDEATAEAGSVGARVLEQHLRTVTDGRTAIIVGHRLTQAVTADRIAVMSDGEIVELGTHAELVAREGVYGSLWRAWAGTRTPVE